MALDGYFLKNLIIEVSEQIIGARVERIIQSDKDIFVFSLYRQGKRHYLYIKLNAPGAAFFLSDTINLIEQQTSSLLTNLKANFEGYILSNIIQYKLDRVVSFNLIGNDFLDGKISKTIILELMGRHNNLIILDSDQIIIDAFNKKFDPNNRSILPRNKFEFFPSSKKVFDGDLDSLESESFLSKTYLGISPLLSKHLYYNNLDIDNIEVRPSKNLNDNTFYWFNLFGTNDNIETFDSLSKLLASNLTNSSSSNNRFINFTNKELKKYNKTLLIVKDKLKASYEKLPYKDIGDAIYSCGLNLNNSYSSINDYNGKQINIDPSISLNMNAQKYYKLYQKAKRSIDHLNEQIIDLTSTINVLEQIQYDLSNDGINFDEIQETLIPFGFKIKKVSKQRKEKNRKINPIKIIYNDAIFYVGKNNIQNEHIVNYLSKHTDYWFHIKDQPGSHVILKGILSDENLLIGAMLAAKHSKESGNPIVSVNYTLVKNLRKIPGTKGYNVTLKEFKTINIKIDNSLLEKIYIANHLI